jgi:hypothetical protein
VGKCVTLETTDWIAPVLGSEAVMPLASRSVMAAVAAGRRLRRLLMEQAAAELDFCWQRLPESAVLRIENASR